MVDDSVNKEEAVAVASFVLRGTEYILSGVRQILGRGNDTEFFQRTKMLTEGREKVDDMRKMIPQCWEREKEHIDFRLNDINLIGKLYEDVCVKSDKSPRYYNCESLRYTYLHMLENTKEYIDGSIVMAKTRK